MDTTERLRAYALCFDHSPHARFVIELLPREQAGYRLLYGNPALAQLLQLPEIATPWKNRTEFLGLPQRDWMEMFIRMQDTPMDCRGVGGEYLQARCYASEDNCRICLLTDITAQRQAEEQFRQEQERYALLLNATPGG
ncbi:MAG: hypothetical protein RR295_07630, partial [Oscillospiraceae bacterium]